MYIYMCPARRKREKSITKNKRIFIEQVLKITAMVRMCVILLILTCI